jgi:GNAT superfamily N-acetyltransferase
MEEIKLREATTADIDTLLRFEQGVISAERPFDPTLKENTNYYDIPGMIRAPHIHLIVATAGDEIIGSGYARIEESKHYLQHTQHAYLGFMYVEPAWRGKGINRMIMEELERWSLSKNMVEMRLDVYYKNASAIHAYEKAGFISHMILMRKPVKYLEHGKDIS